MNRTIIIPLLSLLGLYPYFIAICFSLALLFDGELSALFLVPLEHLNPIFYAWGDFAAMFFTMYVIGVGVLVTLFWMIYTARYWGSEPYQSKSKFFLKVLFYYPSAVVAVFTMIVLCVGLV